MSIVFLGLGSNIGIRQKNITDALDSLECCGVHIQKCSTIIETEPVGGPPQGKFLNAVAKAETLLTPEKLLKETQTIEKKLGRLKTVINGPRTIDIDILLYDDLRISMPELTIPHPRMFEREFVLKPLSEIAPEIINQCKP
ncbi:MAG: 2-amino-4-hydroxy-6-hydroxymethyldihydropteridine diphosphokinase [Candidatus Omnitrophica bacterium]|nr:2-amino-4-hydroxy-6-hydroxymethyldihydropteridine diphosphokinase [Candidatus Omnitrophota bacterium]